MKLQWYPGHMTKARREMTENVRKVDLVMEVLDARIPRSSRNPDVDEIAANKYRLILLNKSDLAEKAVTDAWIRHFESAGIRAVSLDGRTKTALKYIEKTIAGVCSDLMEKRRKKGILKPQVRILVAGIPNTGKSTIINSLAGKNSLKTGNKPGVTKASQWLMAGGSLVLLDTPGILWPKFEDPAVGELLAVTNAIKAEVVDREALAAQFLLRLCSLYPDAVRERYKIEAEPEDSGYDLLEKAARKRGFLISGGETDTERMANTLLTEYHSGRLGRLTLEAPPEGR